MRIIKIMTLACGVIAFPIFISNSYADTNDTDLLRKQHEHRVNNDNQATHGGPDRRADNEAHPANTQPHQAAPSNHPELNNNVRIEHPAPAPVNNMPSHNPASTTIIQTGNSTSNTTAPSGHVTPNNTTQTDKHIPNPAQPSGNMAAPHRSFPTENHTQGIIEPSGNTRPHNVMPTENTHFETLDDRDHRALFDHRGSYDRDRNYVDRYHEHPRYYREMPFGYKTIIAAGITYFVLDNLWYVMHDDLYEQVPAPSNVTIIENPPEIPGNVTIIDINGIRYYFKDGRYYRRDISGLYLEVTPPLQ